MGCSFALNLWLGIWSCVCVRACVRACMRACLGQFPNGLILFHIIIPPHLGPQSNVNQLLFLSVRYSNGEYITISLPLWIPDAVVWLMTYLWILNGRTIWILGTVFQITGYLCHFGEFLFHSPNKDHCFQNSGHDQTSIQMSFQFRTFLDRTGLDHPNTNKTKNLDHYCMEVMQLVSTCTELVPYEFSGEVRREHDIFI